ncbi:probable receptor-like serine/threonine-protein kinase At5g57670 [Typha latifolia]|uniref:probable receptor-like serine/threonine-protein kinase At5g57670 n=1 Tax=Typha latifolia TaxID=4733 RepID=UPI003C2E0EEA
MDTIEECPPSSRILVGVSLDARASMELLSWAVGVAAHTNDTVVALHVLVGKDRKKINSEKTRLRQAKAFVISMLGEFVEASERKQVKLEAKVRTSSSIGRGLIDEAAHTEASYLLVGSSRNSTQRSSYEISNYCFMYAPKGCSVIAIGKQGMRQNAAELDPETHQDNRISTSRWDKSDTNLAKSLSPLRKLLKAYSKREKLQSLSESIDEKTSPRAVLDGPEGRQQVLEDCSSPSSNDTGVRSRRNIWRRLSFIRTLFPYFRSTRDSIGKESDLCSSYTEEQKPLWRLFSYQEISIATDNFHSDNMVGRGGFAEVYKGTLDDGQCIAVKRLAKGKTDENKEKEFLIELGILGHVCHPNTAYLLGCCIENGLHLIFELCPNGTLASALHGKDNKLLDWPVRYKIAVGIARGLHYLHKCCRHRVIHRDIKASNVLLGVDFEPQISDFGLAKWLPKQWSHHSVIPIEGTFGYLAPEYFMHGIVDEKTDVFAFGVLLLEIVTGRRPVDSSKQNLIQWAKPLLEAGKITELADPNLRGEYDRDQLQRLVQIASNCIRQPSIWRPSMSKVLHLLSGSHDLKASERWKMLEIEVDEMDDCSLDTDCYYPY